MNTYEETIWREAMSKQGCMWALRENRVDSDGFNRLIAAVDAARAALRRASALDRKMVACLFEIPWEMENTVPHYRARDEQLGLYVSQLADRVREAIHPLLWDGIEPRPAG
jgi:hypothetical protein